MKRKILSVLAALSLGLCVVSTQGCYDAGYPGGYYGGGGGYPAYAYRPSSFYGPAYVGHPWGYGYDHYGYGGWGHGYAVGHGYAGEHGFAGAQGFAGAHGFAGSHGYAGGHSDGGHAVAHSGHSESHHRG